MKGLRATSALTPVAAVISAMAALVCCLPWGLVLLAVGLIQILRRGRSCRRRSRTEITLWAIAAVIVLVVALFPQWVASFLAHQP
jgi:hypothetical protein